MAQDFREPVMTNGVGRALIAGKFTTADGTAPTGVTGEGFTVARTAEGRFTVTINSDPRPSQIISLLVGLHREGLPSITSDVRELVQCYVDQDTLTASVFEVQVRLTNTIGTTPDAVLDDQPGAEIHFQAFVQYAGSNSD